MVVPKLLPKVLKHHRRVALELRCLLCRGTFGRQRVVVDDGGWADNHQVGMHILSVDAARYERHWTMADTARRRAERQCEQERAAAIKAAKAALPKGLRPGTPSYIDAMDAALQRRGF